MKIQNIARFQPLLMATVIGVLLNAVATAQNFVDITITATGSSNLITATYNGSPAPVLNGFVSIPSFVPNSPPGGSYGNNNYIYPDPFGPPPLIDFIDASNPGALIIILDGAGNNPTFNTPIVSVGTDSSNGGQVFIQSFDDLRADVGVAPLVTPRAYATATLLPNGKVLIAGGVTEGEDNDGANGSTSAEIYDPATGTSSATGSLNTGRSQHTATLLPNGKVLIAGGLFNYGDNLNSAEIYDPATGNFSVTGSMTVVHYVHTATLLSNGKVLVAGGYGPEGNVAVAELYNPATGTWTATGSLNTARNKHSATLLPNGQVLVTGGFNSYDVLSSAEIYDPTTELWTVTNSMSNARSQHTSILLPNGKVLVAGGVDSNFESSTSTELYDPNSGAWSATGDLVSPRAQHTATLLPDGKALVLGGSDGDYFTPDAVNSAEAYDPTTGMWTATDVTLSIARHQQTATLLPGGRVFIAGGYGTNGTPVANAEFYDPTAGSGTNTGTDFWSATGSLETPRAFATATLLPNGKVLIAGGVIAGDDNFEDVNGSTSAEIYDPAAGTFSATGSLNTGRSQHTATLLPNGKVLIAGGIFNYSDNLNSAEIYDPATGTFSVTGSMTAAHYNHTATLLTNGKVLVAGGYGPSGNVAVAEIYDPATGTWTATGSLNTARNTHAATLLTNGQVLVTGGFYFFDILSSAEIYDPTTGLWTTTNSMIEARSQQTSTLLPNGEVLVTGGIDSSFESSSSAELYNPATGAWTATGDLATARAQHTATLLPNGKVLVAGGSDAGYYSPEALNTAELYDPATGMWSVTGGPLSDARYQQTATLLPSGQVLVAGGYGSAGTFVCLSSAELYDPGLGFCPAWQPQVGSAAITATGKVVLTGAGFNGLSSASGGNGSQDSPTSYPLVQLRRMDNEQSVFISPDPCAGFSATTFTSLPLTNYPAGYAQVTVFANGIPSSSFILADANISSSMPIPFSITSYARLANGSFQFSFTNNPGLYFTALGSEDLSGPSCHWNALGAASEVAPGQYQFIDAQAATNKIRFYRAGSQ